MGRFLPISLPRYRTFCGYLPFSAVPRSALPVASVPSTRVEGGSQPGHLAAINGDTAFAYREDTTRSRSVQMAECRDRKRTKRLNQKGSGKHGDVLFRYWASRRPEPSSNISRKSTRPKPQDSSYSRPGRSSPTSTSRNVSCIPTATNDMVKTPTSAASSL